MTIDLNRRSFLKGLAGVAVIAALPPLPVSRETPAIAQTLAPPAEVTPPLGTTYNWVRTSLMGVPDIENIETRINEGWTFVAPSAHPELETADADIAFERHGLILMQLPTDEVNLRREYELYRKRDKLSVRMTQILDAYPYLVAHDGSIITPKGTPFTGYVTPNHRRIADKWQRRAAATTQAGEAA